jgi:hypothetical protein
MVLDKTPGDVYRVGLDTERKESIRWNLVRTRAKNSVRVYRTESQ